MVRRPAASAVLVLLLAAAVAPPGGAREGAWRARLRALAGPPAASPAADAIRGPGDYRVATRHDGLERLYRVHVPRSYDGRRAVPLLFALHGGGGHMDHLADDARVGLIAKSEQAGFVVVFPNGVGRLPGGRLATWNAGACCGDARDRAVDDVGFLRQVHVEVSRQLRIDPGRVYAAGMSNGAMMAYRLACDAADLVRAIAAVAGTDNTRRCTPSRAVAVLHIHARDDSHVLYAGGAGPGAHADRTAITDFRSVPATLAAWRGHNRCDSRPRRVVDVPGATCEVYSLCVDGARVQACTTATGGHSWPGPGPATRGRSPSSALSATDTLWAFFDALPAAP